MHYLSGRQAAFEQHPDFGSLPAGIKVPKLFRLYRYCFKLSNTTWYPFAYI